MPQFRSYGSVRGAVSDDRPYRDRLCPRGAGGHGAFSGDGKRLGTESSVPGFSRSLARTKGASVRRGCTHSVADGATGGVTQTRILHAF
jgi:hypothetical protein